jgi:hypothetical protein
LDYRVGPWTLSFTAENLTDEIFAQAAIAAGSNTVDAPRSYYVSGSRNF